MFLCVCDGEEFNLHARLILRAIFAVSHAPSFLSVSLLPQIHDLTEILDSSEAEKIAARFRTGWKCKAIRVPSGSVSPFASCS